MGDPATAAKPLASVLDKTDMNLAYALRSSCLQLFWPARCAGCDALLASDSAALCGRCAHATLPIAGACAGCALPQSGPTPRGRCPGCARLDFAFSRAFAAFEYGGPLADAIVRMKHGGRPDLAGRLGRLLAGVLGRALVLAVAGGAGGDAAPADIVMPVPLHARKLRRRGFNQALELARVALGQLAVRVPGARLPRLERRLLERTKDTRELGRAGPGARRVELYGAFRVPDRARVAGRRIVIVDDVMTTGATFGEAAETLVRAGAAEVRVVALARALR